MLHILVGEEAALEDVRQAAANRKPVGWIVPKAAKPGDKVVLFFPHLRGFFAHGETSSTPKSTSFGRKPAFEAAVGNIISYGSPIPLKVVADRFPNWRWVDYPRSLTTPKPPAVAAELLSFLLTQDSM